MAPVKNEEDEMNENVPKLLCQMDNHLGLYILSNFNHLACLFLSMLDFIVMHTYVYNLSFLLWNSFDILQLLETVLLTIHFVYMYVFEW